MAAAADTPKPHAVCVPFPAQGHINPFLQFAKLLHLHGFHVTFVHTDYNRRRLLLSRGPHALDGLPTFRFHTIPDGLPSGDGDVADATQDIASLCRSTSTTCHPHFLRLLRRLNSPSSASPPVTCIISDGVMSFTLEAAEELSIPVVLFWTVSACGMLGYAQYPALIQRGLAPLKDPGDLSNGYIDTVLHWIPGVDGIRLRDIPTFIRTTDPNDTMIHFVCREIRRIPLASAVILNTFDAMEAKALNALSGMLLPAVYSVGPLQLLLDRFPPDDALDSVGSNLWKEQAECVEWLDAKDPGSVVYVNFGSITVISPQQLAEFAWGLASTGRAFLWIIRPDLVSGDAAILPPEFLSETQGRGMLASWCPQEQVLKHPSVGVFLTHSGWNSTMESVAGGVPMICWPFFAEQVTNCRYSCGEWGVAAEMEADVRREKVGETVAEVMEGERGSEMRRRAAEWRRKSVQAARPGGSSHVNMGELIGRLLRSPV